MGDWMAATEAQQETFSHLVLMSVELAPQEAAAPIGFFLQSETLFEAQVEHLILWLEVGVPSRLLVDPVQFFLGAGRSALR